MDLTYRIHVIPVYCITVYSGESSFCNGSLTCLTFLCAQIHFFGFEYALRNFRLQITGYSGICERVNLSRGGGQNLFCCSVCL